MLIPGSITTVDRGVADAVAAGAMSIIILVIPRSPASVVFLAATVLDDLRTS